MLILDANILLYAFNDAAPQHGRVRDWLAAQIENKEAIALPWLSLWAFLRISTHPHGHPNPLTLAEAFETIRDIQAIPRSTIVHPGPEHHRVLEDVASQGQANGSLMTDAVLAALAVEHGATLVSTDRDFARFPGLKWINPLD